MSTAYSVNCCSSVMIKKSFLLTLWFPLSCLATPSVEVLFNTNPSVVKVHVANNKGNHGVGSGVVVAKNYIVTNCHVIANSQGIHVTTAHLAIMVVLLLLSVPMMIPMRSMRYLCGLQAHRCMNICLFGFVGPAGRNSQSDRRKSQ